LVANDQGKKQKKKIESSPKNGEHNTKYYVQARPSISDYEFDMMMKELVA